MYKYSHSKLLELLEIRSFKYIYEYFYREGKDAALENEPALKKNKEVYREAFEQFLTVLQGKTDPVVLITQ